MNVRWFLGQWGGLRTGRPVWHVEGWKQGPETVETGLVGRKGEDGWQVGSFTRFFSGEFIVRMTVRCYAILSNRLVHSLGKLGTWVLSSCGGGPSEESVGELTWGVRGRKTWGNWKLTGGRGIHFRHTHRRREVWHSDNFYLWSSTSKRKNLVN